MREITAAVAIVLATERQLSMNVEKGMDLVKTTITVFLLEICCLKVNYLSKNSTNIAGRYY